VGKDQTSADGVVIKTPNIDESFVEPCDIKNTPRPPVIIIPLVDTIISISSPVKVFCKVIGFPFPTVFYVFFFFFCKSVVIINLFQF
jgi:hypothetical protein